MLPAVSARIAVRRLRHRPGDDRLPVLRGDRFQPPRHRHVEHRHPVADRRATGRSRPRLRHLLVDAIAARAPAIPADTSRPSSTKRRSIPVKPTIRPIPRSRCLWSGVTAMSTLCRLPRRREIPVSAPGCRSTGSSSGSSDAGAAGQRRHPLAQRGGQPRLHCALDPGQHAPAGVRDHRGRRWIEPTISWSARSSSATAAADDCASSPANARDRGAPVLGARAARGAQVVFLDGHCYTPLLAGLVAPLADPGIGLVGCAFADLRRPGHGVGVGCTWGKRLRHLALAAAAVVLRSRGAVAAGGCQAMRTSVVRHRPSGLRRISAARARSRACAAG